MTLRHDRHERDAAGLTYVYPVVSRRARGVSVGINLNTNRACNWRCVYCQVPGLVRGKAPEVDLGQLERELRAFVRSIALGDFLAEHVPEDSRRWNDIAFSGDGEPTSSPQFAGAVAIARDVLDEFDPLGSARLVLITNGSLVHQRGVQDGLRLFGTRDEVWFKLDSATEEGLRAINDVAPGLERVRTNLRTAAELAPTWIQTCVFARNGEPPSEAEQAALVEFLGERVKEGVALHGVLLYGLARESHQPEASELSRLDLAWLERYAARIATTGLEVRVHP